MYQKNNIGCLAFLFVCAIVLGIAILIGVLATKLIIWFVLGVFIYDLSDKFWYIFVALMFILPMLKGIFTINVSNK